MIQTISLHHDQSEAVQYNSSDLPVSLHKQELSVYPNYRAISHWHDDLEFLVVLSGSMQFNVNGEVSELRAGDGIAVNSRQLHFGFSDTHGECTFLCLLFHPALLCANRYIEQAFIRPLTSGSSFSFQLLCARTDWQEQILQSIRTLYEKRDSPAFALIAQTHLFEIFSLLFAHDVQTPPLSQRGNDHQLSALREMIGYIQKHYSEKIALADIAAAGSVCKSNCCAIFHHYLCKSPIQYLSDFRLDQSTVLLRATDCTIAEISYAVGFSGASYYTETFRATFGCTPSAYRKQNRTEVLPVFRDS